MISQFPQVWREQLANLKFSELTAIQKQIFEPISQGDNVLGVSPTGTGKTLAYLFPTLLNVTPKITTIIDFSTKYRTSRANF